VGLSLAPYLDRTFDLTSSDTIMLRGNPVEVSDRVAADGGVSDVRAALGWRPAPPLQVGVGVHFLTGSTRLSTVREFSDTLFAPLRDSSQASFFGTGFSLGAVLAVAPRTSVAVVLRTDRKLDRRVDAVETGSLDLPVSVTGGFAFAPQRALRVATTVTWRSWSDAEGSGVSAFDTWEAAAGIELGGPDVGASRAPLRVGVRYAQLPFSPTDDQPTEWIVAGGTAYPFAAGRALIEVALERVFRDGGGARERAWQLSVGLGLVP
jgi:hypothetical protein